MSTKQLRVNSLWTNFRDAIKNDESWNAGSKQDGRWTLRGIHMPKPSEISMGRLSDDWARDLRKSYDLGGVDYIIYSYGTPIAWRSWGTWITPDEKYSVTTTKHQGRINTAVHNLT